MISSARICCVYANEGPISQIVRVGEEEQVPNERNREGGPGNISTRMSRRGGRSVALKESVPRCWVNVDSRHGQ